MNFINRIEIQGRVGSHKIELGKSGSWGGWFDLHSEGFDGMPAVFDCRVEEDGKNVEDLGAGIEGKFVKVEGRLIPWDDSFYVHVTKLSIVGGVRDV